MTHLQLIQYGGLPGIIQPHYYNLVFCFINDIKYIIKNKPFYLPFQRGSIA